MKPFNFYLPRHPAARSSQVSYVLCADVFLLLCQLGPCHPFGLFDTLPNSSSLFGETVSHWFPWMIYLLHVSIGLSIADNLLVISGSRLRIRKTCYDLDSHFLNLTENIVLALVLCLISPAETKILSYSLHWVEPGVSWSFLRVMEDEIRNKSIFDWHKSLVNKPASSLLNLFQYWPIEILENHFSAITRHTKSISAWRCAVKTWQSRKWEHREKKWLNMPRNKVKS